jgi:hypothetical protein
MRRHLLRRASRTLSAAAFVAVLALPAAAARDGQSTAAPGSGLAPVAFCHASSPTGGTFVALTSPASTVYRGHVGGHDASDIVPPFTVEGNPFSQNWDTNGQATFNNGCVVPVTPSPPAIQPPPPTQAPPPSPPPAEASPPVPTATTQSSSTSPAEQQATTATVSMAATLSASTLEGGATAPPAIVVTSAAVPVPVTTPLNKPVTVVARTTPKTVVLISGAGVHGSTRGVTDKRGVAQLEVIPTKPGVMTVRVHARPVKRIGVLPERSSGRSLTG